MIWLFPLAILSGILGRMGGAAGYHTLWRDLGCSITLLIAVYLVFGFSPSHWYAYLLIFGLSWAALSTYWDFLFGFDNLWFSGFMMGAALLPLLIVNVNLWPFVLLRSLILAVVWGCLNKFLPKKVGPWGRDVAEEWGRYTVAV